jgi:membrane-associated phospholipid phosphatase/tRNA A-37 threonylcarbamoyl transferase component Bud32
MDTAPGQAQRTAQDATGPLSAPAAVPVSPAARWRRRRPTGEPPPLPRHLQTTGLGWLLAAVALVILSLLVFAAGRYGRGVTLTVVDDWVVERLAALRRPVVTEFMRAVSNLLGTVWTVKVLSWGTLLLLLVFRRLRHLVVAFVSLEVVSAVVIALSEAVRRPRPFGVAIEGHWAAWAMPSRPVAYLAAILVAMLYSLVPEGRWRQAGKLVATGLVALLALARIYLGVDHPSDVLVGAAIGVAIPLLAFRWFVPNEVFPVAYRRGRSAHLDVGGARGQAIRRALHDQLGLVVEEIKPFGLAGSAGSTPLRIKLKGEPSAWLFGKLYARSHLRSDRWYKLGRELLYGRLEDEKPFNTVRRLVQQEDYALRLCRAAGLPSPTPFGFVELTPEREYLLVTEFFEGAVELGEAEVDDAVIDDGLAIIRKLWDAGLAHRDIKPANLLVRGEQVLLIDVAFVQVRPSPWRQAVDLANMMLCLGLRCSAQQVYQRALRQFSVEEISEGFAAARGLALPSQLRRLLRAQGRDLHAEFVRLLPAPPQPIVIQRWSARRVGLLALMLALLLVVAVPTLAISLNNEIATKTPLGIHSLGCDHPEPLWLEAQSVPSASLVPCVRSLPAGWTIANLAVNDGRSVLTFDNDRAGPAAAVVRLAADCGDTAGTVAATATEPAVRRYQRTERQAGSFTATWYDRFPGGCVTMRLTGPAGDRAELTSEASLVLDYTSREALRRALEARSSGRLHLDPGTT